MYYLGKGYFMKVWFIVVAGVFLFSGCSTKTQNYRLRTANAKQAALIQKQQAIINALQSKLQRQYQINSQKSKIVQRKNETVSSKNTTLPPAPKKVIKLKKVEDNNYSSSYMYPKTKKVSTPKTQASTPSAQKQTISSMTKEECISMIGADKFAKYTAMFGSEAASIKRCKILKSMTKQ